GLLPSSSFVPSHPGDPNSIEAAFLAAAQDRSLDPLVVRRVAEFFARYEREPLPPVGPVRWEVFLEEWTGRLPASLPPVMRAFTEWAGQGLSDIARAEVMAVLDELLA